MKCLKNVSAPATAATSTNTKITAFCNQKLESQPIAQIKAEQIDTDTSFSRLKIEHTELAKNWKCQRQKANIKQETNYSTMDNGVTDVPMRLISASDTLIVPIDRHSGFNDSQINHSTRLPPDLIPFSCYNLGFISRSCDHHETPLKNHFLASTVRTSFTSGSKEQTIERALVVDGKSESKNQLSFLPLRRFSAIKHENSFDHRGPITPTESFTSNGIPVQGKKKSKYCIKSYPELFIARKFNASSSELANVKNDAVEYLLPQELTLPYARSSVDGSTRFRLGLPSPPNKICNTSCGLKKHTHQSLIQYGCTFPDCYRVFRSKKIWRRHESGQHFQLESWRCHLPRSLPNHRKCARVFFRAEAFRNHIYEHHKLKEPPKIVSEHWKGRIGRNGQGSFWCGFCREVLQLRERAIAAWEERFRHIEGHFTAGDDISSWFCIFTDETKRNIFLKRMSNGNIRYLTSESTARDLTVNHKKNYTNHVVKSEKQKSHDIDSVKRSDWPE